MACSIAALFVGDGTLLVRCASLWLERGHAVAGVLSDDAAVRRWAGQQGLPCEGVRVDEPLPGARFDYLFSVANLHVLPASLLGRAQRLALNFHDGPLPRYAGLHATSWALMAGEAQHGVTWHEMTDAVDRGRIARQQRFDLAPDETALSLNARCYEAGWQAFAELVGDIEGGTLALEPARGSTSYFGRDLRPQALGTLDFSQPAREVCALVRALDFGPYPNPLARAKVWLGPGMLAVTSAEIAGPPAQEDAQQAAGTVTATGEGWLEVCAPDQRVRLSGCVRMSETGTSWPAVGQVLPRVPAAVVDRLSTRLPALARGETHWRTVLPQCPALTLPYPTRSERQESGGAPVHRLPLQARERGAITLAAFAAWLAALSGQGRVGLLYADASLARAAEGIEAWASPEVPLCLCVEPVMTVPALTAQAQAQRDAALQAGPLTRDLRWRLGGGAPAVLPRHGLRVGAAAGALDPAGSAAPDRAMAPALELELQCEDSGGALVLRVAADRYTPFVAQVMAQHLDAWLQSFGASQGLLADLPLTTPHEAARLAALNDTALPLERHWTVHEAVARQARLQPHAVALQSQDGLITHQQLQQRVESLAQALHERGVRRGDIVGLCLERRASLVVSVLAVLRCGAAYLPLDPQYPAERLRFMREDSRVRFLLRDEALATQQEDEALLTLTPDILPQSADAVLPEAGPEDLAYVIYTSGSTGRPKGVQVTHGNVQNFLAGMDRRVPHEGGGRWLAVTSLSFDISVLELLWTLTRGFTVVLAPGKPAAAARRPMDFSLFFFASDVGGPPAGDRYRLLLEAARFADRHGFTAVWTPERHFHAFGGLYPNPALTSAALATITERVQLRAGSCVLPLHHPLRLAEDWALVDNLSHGRVGVSFAAGWQPRDFVLAPQAFEERKRLLLEGIATVRRLWRGESLPWPGPQGRPVSVQTLPRPVQPELPVWLTAASNPETFEQAGAAGCHVLTHLLGQSLDDVQAKVALYRAAWQAGGHAGRGKVSLMLHAFIGEDEAQVREMARGPMKAYLRSSVDLIRQAAWTFPTFVQRAAADGRTPLEVMEQAPLSDAEMDALLDHAFDRYWRASALIGTPEQGLATVERLRAAGIDEIACLIDFGVDTDQVLSHLEDLRQLMLACQRPPASGDAAGLAQQMNEQGITHLQCTPSMASILVADDEGREALGRLQALLVGGEALPLGLARELRARVPGQLLNMYGPTETTVWSTCCNLEAIGDFIPLGEPIANTWIQVRNAWGQECPALVPGELLIGGAGVSRGYLRRPQLDAQRFLPDPRRPGQRLYRTGDLVRWHPDGQLEFLGRLDHQVKIRGHRIELGEIEALLAGQPGVREAVVLAQREAPQESMPASQPGVTAPAASDTGASPLSAAAEMSLVAHVTAREDAPWPHEAALRRALAQALPEIMVPRRILVHRSFPLTPNGKTDRLALGMMAAPAVPAASSTQGTPAAATGAQGVASGTQTSRQGLREAAAPPAPDQTAFEQQVSQLWCQVLGLPSVPRDANFFDLGGHSLLVVQVQRRLREATGVEISVADMFRLTTVAAIAAHLERQRSPAARQGPGALDEAQRRARLRQAWRAQGRTAP